MADTLAYNHAKWLLMNGRLNLAEDDIRVLLVDGSYVSDANHRFVADVAGSELHGPGYNRPVLVGESVAEDDPDDRAVFDADGPLWPGADFGTVDAIIAFKFVTDDSDSPVICCLNLDPKITTNTGTYGVAFNIAGIMRLL